MIVFEYGQVRVKTNFPAQSSAGVASSSSLSMLKVACFVNEMALNMLCSRESFSKLESTVSSELMKFFARNLWRRLWDATAEQMPDLEESGADSDSTDTETESRLRFSVLDRDGDGIITVEDVHFALKESHGL